MGRFFSLDGGIMCFLTKVSDICIISILWLIFCIPVVTLGASTTAAYYTMVKVVRRERGTVLKEFFKSFTQNLKDSMIINIVYLFLFGILGFNIYCMYQELGNTDNGIAFQMLFIYLALLLLLITICIYTYPVLSRFEMKRFTLVKFSVLIMIRNFPVSLLLLAIFIISFIIMVVCPLGVLFVPGVCLYLYSFFMEKILRKYMTEEMIVVWDGVTEEKEIEIEE